MGRTEEWDSQNLELSGTTDVAWAQEKNKNKRISEAVPETTSSLLLQVREAPFTSKEIWDDITR
jgi:hypothetical protein